MHFYFDIMKLAKNVMGYFIYIYMYLDSFYGCISIGKCWGKRLECV